MKNLKNIFLKAQSFIALFFVSIFSAVSAHAQDQVNISNLEQRLSNVPKDVSNMINPVINVVLLIFGLAVIASLVIAYINKRKDNNSGSNDKLIDTLWTALVVLLGIYAVKFFFFGQA